MKNINKIILVSFLIFFVGTLSSQSNTPKYIFLLIGDGMGVSQVKVTDVYMRNTQNDSLLILSLPISGLSSTSSASHLITCSAAAGTALATGYKTSNGTISLTPDFSQKLKSIGFYAKEAGMKVGIVSNAPINHATPAVFYAHQSSRNNYVEIALEMPKSDFDFFGGGRFILKGENKKNAYKLMSEAGYKVDSTKKAFEEKSQMKRFVYSPKEKNGYNENALPYIIDLKEDEFKLTDYSKMAIQQLENSKGFFLMVEGGLIDWACHSNDAGTTIAEVIEFDNVVKQAFEFYNKYPNETLIVVTADHETGGIALGNYNLSYNSNIELIENQKISKSNFSKLIENTENINIESALELAKEYYGLNGSNSKLSLSEADKKMLEYGFNLQFSGINKKLEYPTISSFACAVTKIFNDKVGIGFTTYAHTASPVPIFAIGVGSELFGRYIDNTQIAKEIIKLIEK